MMEVGSKCPRCGAVVLRADQCPALCIPLPLPRPPYRGPLVIGLSHTGRLGRPVSLEDDRD